MNNLISTETVIEVAYLIATALFILSLKWLSSPTTARRGVFAGEAGMVLAIAGTLLHHGIVDYKWIAIALVLGTVIGIPLGNVQMTAVPQRTALSHAFGALCVTLVGTAEFYLRAPNIAPFMMAVLSMEVILGSLTFTGSLMAAGKLQEILPQRPITYKGQNFVNLALLACAVGIAAILMVHPEQTKLFPAMIIIPLIFGVMLVIPIGGADMPTVISLLNSYAEQQVADHSRRVGRLLGLHSVGDHVQGHEPIVHQCVVRWVRANSDQRRRRSEGSAAGSQRYARRSVRDSCGGKQSSDRPRVWYGGGASAA
jgi:NAD(P) transhydrogenase subunit beta